MEAWKNKFQEEDNYIYQLPRCGWQWHLVYTLCWWMATTATAGQLDDLMWLICRTCLIISWCNHQIIVGAAYFGPGVFRGPTCCPQFVRFSKAPICVWFPAQCISNECSGLITVCWLVPSCAISLSNDTKLHVSWCTPCGHHGYLIFQDDVCFTRQKTQTHTAFWLLSVESYFHVWKHCLLMGQHCAIKGVS